MEKFLERKIIEGCPVNLDSEDYSEDLNADGRPFYAKGYKDCFESLIEIGVIASIITSNLFTEVKNFKRTGWFATYEAISELAKEFYIEFEDVEDWIEKSEQEDVSDWEEFIVKWVSNKIG